MKALPRSAPPVLSHPITARRQMPPGRRRDWRERRTSALLTPVSSPHYITAFSRFARRAIFGYFCSSQHWIAASERCIARDSGDAMPSAWTEVAN
jgi:hypothetical protein